MNTEKKRAAVSYGTACPIKTREEALAELERFIVAKEQQGWEVVEGISDEPPFQATASDITYMLTAAMRQIPQ